jgi:hypothetical protein
VTFVATDNGTPSLNASVPVSITVVAQNRAPVLDPIGPRFTTEGATLQFLVTATDPDGTIPQLSLGPAPPSATLIDQGNGTGLFTYVPAYVEAGLVSVEFRASDGLATDKEVVLIQVNEAGNQPPTFLPLPPASVTERDSFSVVIVSSDPDSTADTITMVTPVPENATFTYNGDGTATFEFVPWFTQEGNYALVFATTDGEFVDTITFQLTVLDVGNQAPFLHAINNPASPIPDKTFREELRDSLLIQASDLDSTIAVLSARNLPAGATFLDLNNGVGRLTWKPDFSQAGVYQVTFLATDVDDAALYDSQLVTLTVQNFFPAPVWNPTIVKDHVVPEGTTLDLPMSSIPIDTTPTFRAQYKPQNSVFIDNGDGTCRLIFTPSYFQAGTDSAILQAVHPLDTTLRTPLKLNFSIPNTPQPPIWQPQDDTTVTENIQLRLFVIADDPDGTNPLLSAPNLPVGATFTTVFTGGGSATGRFQWTPDFSQDGIYDIHFVASDGTGEDTLTVRVTVLDAGNQAPIFTVPPTDQAIIIPETLLVRVVAVDPDSTTPILTVPNLPRNASFVDSGNGVGGLVFTPDGTQQDSIYAVTFVASDGLLSNSVTVTYFVYDFVRGDVNGSGEISSADIIYLVNFVFKAGIPPQPVAAGDVNKDGFINASDVIYLVNFVFKGGPPPPLVAERDGWWPFGEAAVTDEAAAAEF